MKWHCTRSIIAGLLLAFTSVSCGSEVKEVVKEVTVVVTVVVTPTPGERTPTLTRTATPIPTPTPTAAPSPPPAPVVKRLGDPTTLTGTGTTNAGTEFTIIANDFRDPVRSTNQFNTPRGRWVLVDWTIRNDGTKDVRFSALEFKLQTADGFVLTYGNHAGHPEPDLDSGTLGPGQVARGFLAYDVPDGQQVKALIYQVSGSRQFVIADLTAQ